MSYLPVLRAISAGEAVTLSHSKRETARATNKLESLRTGAREELVSALHEGYRERAGELPAGFEARRPVYEAVRFLGVSGFVEEWAASLDEPADDLSEWIDEEMDRRLAAIR